MGQRGASGVNGSSRVVRWVGVVVLAAAGLLLAGCEAAPPYVYFSVTTAVDGPDAVPGDGVCEVTPGAGDCSVRAAFDEANRVPVSARPWITIPAGTYALTRPGVDDTNGGGDLDLDLLSDFAVVHAPAPGAVLDAVGADGVIDVHRGRAAVLGVALVGATTGARVHGGAELTLGAVSVHGNTGAGVVVDAGATAAVTNSTVSGNGAGGVANAGSLDLTFATVTRNSGGGVTGAGALAAEASIVADQASGADCAVGVSSRGGNLDSDGSCGLTGAADATAADARLAPLSSDPLARHLPLAGSPALDVVALGTGACDGFSTDQLGVTRPLDAACDRGAVEAAGPTLVVTHGGDAVDGSIGDGTCQDAGGAPGACSLRAAAQEANAAGGPVTILIDGAVPTVTLSRAGAGEDAGATGDLDVTGSLTIHGNGAVVDGAQLDTVLDVRPGAHAAIDDLTVRNGKGVGGHAGGLDNAGDLRLDRVTITANVAGTLPSAGGLAQRGGSLLVTDSVISGNSKGPQDLYASSGEAGGLGVSGGTATIDRTTISGNAGQAGAGVSVTGGALVLTASTISDNHATESTYYCGWYGCITLSVGNSGGGLELVGGTAEITASTISGNTSSAGEAIRTTGPGLTLHGSIVEGGRTDCVGPVASAGFNIDSDGSCGLGEATDRPGTNARLSALADHGGIGATLLPLTSSAAVDAIPAGTAGLCDGAMPFPVVDQRQVLRPVGGACDIGAVEGIGAGPTPLDLTVTSAADRDDANVGDGICADSLGACTLRGALSEANNAPTTDRIDIPAGISPVVSTALHVGDFVRIDGHDTTVRATGADRVVMVTGQSVLMSGVTITGGRVVEDSSADPLGYGHGGGVLLSLGRFELQDGRVTGNGSAFGGGISVAGGSLVLTRSLVDSNEATKDGGGIEVRSAPARVASSTISYNHAGRTGGGMWTATTALDLRLSTVARNTAEAGSAITGVSFSVAGSVIDNPGTDCAVPLTSAGHNLATDTSCGLATATDHPGVPAELGSPAPGDPAGLLVPLPGSPLIDAIPTGTPGLCDGSVPVDQRGTARPVGAGCDTGAVEGDTGFPPGPPLALTVDIAGDTRDALAGDGLCDDGTGHCSLRAAVDEANAAPGADTITIAPGIRPQLARAGAGDDENVTGDLDVWNPVTIQGNGAVIDAARVDRVLHTHADTTLRRLVIYRGSAPTGGGLRHDAGVLTIDRTTFTANLATTTVGSGGGLYLAGGSLHLRNATVSGNTAPVGAGLQLAAGTFDASFATIYDNTATAPDGTNAIGFTAGSTATASLRASIVGGLGIDCGGGVASAGFNLDDDGSCGLTQPTDHPATPARVGVRSGSAVVHRPFTDSVAVDAIPIGTVGLCDGAFPIDQLGQARPGGAGCDVGAVEGPVAAPAPVALTVDVANDARDAVPGDGVCDDGSGHCSLRAAVDEANATMVPDTITIAPAVNPVLTRTGAAEDANATGDLDIRYPVVLHGQGATVDAGGLDRVFHVANGGTTMDHLTITGGVVSSGGGGVRVEVGPVTLEHTTITGNRAPDGGGALVRHGALTVDASSITGNTATKTGGGVYSGPDLATPAVSVHPAQLTVTGSQVDSNTATTAGGGLYVEEGVTTINRSSLDGSTVTGPDASGGGLYVANGTVTVNDASVSDNVLTAGYGGGIYARGALAVTGSTVARNHGAAGGGGLYLDAAYGTAPVAPASVVNSTISGNVASAIGSAVYTAQPLDLTLSTVVAPGGTPAALDSSGYQGSLHAAGSVIATPAGTPACTGPTTSGGFNVVTDLTCALNGPGDRQPQDPALDPLAANGGSTDTHAPTTGSPVIDAIPAGTAGLCDGSITTDQRGQARPTGSACDTGAVEDATGLVLLPLVVDTATDARDAVPGDGVCDDGAGHCPLRAAVDEANASAGAAITIAAGISPTLTRPGVDDTNDGGDLDVSATVVITGLGAGVTVIDGGAIDRVLEVLGGSASLRDLRVTGGSTAAAGGGLRAAGGAYLDLLRVTVDANHAGTYGGGVVVDGAGARLEASRVAANTAPTGGGVHVYAGLVYLGGSTVTGNTATARGGAVSAYDALLTVDRSTLDGNRVTDTFGYGGALDLQASSKAAVTNTTIAANAARNGSAIAANANTLDLTSVTIADNDGPTSIYRYGTIVTLRATVVSTRAGGQACSMTMNSGGFNVAPDRSCGLTGATDRQDTSAQLAPLAANGGPTATMLPYATSPGVDSIPSGTAGLCDGTAPADQRGQPRPVGGACDAGAVEGTGPSRDPLALVVDSAADTVDALPGDGECRDSGGACTLRAAISESNAWPAVDTITITAGIDPTLTRAGRFEDRNATGDLDLTDRLTIEGNGATISGGLLDRVLHLRAGAATLRNLTITGGDARDFFGGFGAGIQQEADLALDHVTVTANTAYGNGGGAGIYSGGGLGAASITLTLTNGALIGNVVNESGGYLSYGGGLYALGTTVTITDSVISGNQARYGAGVEVHTGSTATITRSTLTGNVATSAGGAVYGGPVTLDHSQVTANQAGDTGGGLGLFTGTLLDSQVTGNTARTRGGGIDASGSLTLTRSTIGTNTLSDGAYGAGIAADGPATLTDSQVVDNTGTILATHGDTRGGGGIYSRSTLSVVRTTIVGNALVGSGSGPLAGGGIHVAGSATIDQSLLAGNTVDAGASTASGGGIFGAGGITITRSTLSGNEVHSTGVASGAAIHRELGTVSMQATTIAGNVGPTSLVGTMAVSAVVVDAPAGSAACSVPLTSYGFDVADDATCGLTAPGDLQGVDPLLGALADNGGPTRAHLPLLGSPLLDAIPLAAPSCTAFTADQRGLPRPTGAGCDIGAVER